MEYRYYYGTIVKEITFRIVKKKPFIFIHIIILSSKNNLTDWNVTSSLFSEWFLNFKRENGQQCSCASNCSWTDYEILSEKIGNTKSNEIGKKTTKRTRDEKKINK